MNQFEGKSWEELKKPVAQGGMSMGEGRVLEPPNFGTIFQGCPNSKHESGEHRFVSYANLNSVEYFRCSWCPEEMVD